MSVRALLPERLYRWNFVVMGLDVSIFTLALSFASVYGVLPLFVHHLTPSNLTLGLIPAVRAIGTLLPPILVAGYVERLTRMKPFILGWTIMERVPYLVLALLIPSLAGRHDSLLLWVFFATIALTTLGGGITMPAWLELIARVLPDDWRGRFFGSSGALGALLGIAGGTGAAELLHRFDWPLGFALCFGCTFGCLVVSFVFLALARERIPASRDRYAMALDRSWRRLPALVRGDRNFAWYLAATALTTMAGMATAFYTVDAQRSLHLGDAGAGLYAVVLLIASTVGNVVWGHLGDRFGHKRVLEGGALCTGLAALLAIAARSPYGGLLLYGGVFVLVGLGSSGIQMAALTFVLDFAPQGQRPTYVGLASVAQVPFACAAPLLGGLIADRAGYAAVFGLTALLALCGAYLVLKAVRDPRMNPGESAVAYEAALEKPEA